MNMFGTTNLSLAVNKHTTTKLELNMWLQSYQHTDNCYDKERSYDESSGTT